jgi:hypothetical protein
VGNLEWLDEGGRVQPQNPYQVGTCHPPALAGRDQGLVPARIFGARTHHIHIGEYSLTPCR